MTGIVTAMHVVLDRPLIPQNTGSIARSCAATNTELHLIEPLGFEINEKNVRRAGLDYWPFVKLHQHKSFEHYLSAYAPSNIWLIETGGSRLYTEASFSKDDAIIFGQETKGLSPDFMRNFRSEQILSIPILCSGVRSLNLSNAVSIVLFEALRQLDFDV